MKNTPLRTAMVILVILLVFINIFVYLNDNTVSSPKKPIPSKNTENEANITDKPVEPPPSKPVKTKQTDNEITKQIVAKFRAADLVNVHELDPSIQADLRYGTSNNFLERNLYGGLNECYLQEEVAKMLSKAQEFLKEKQPRLSLLVLDCARPWSVQKAMWEVVKDTNQERYVASPYGGGSIHNYGASVDVTIVDNEGKELDMGTPFDFFGEKAQPRHHQKFLDSGELTLEHITNRERLREVMRKAGFRAIESEWWHFNAFKKELVRKKYKMVE
ncbi:MAG: M15 family metallopeptidase [Chitinophagales bacterium]